jgi:hypothetical protein
VSNDEKFRSRIPALAGTAGGALASAVAGSFFGIAGTTIGIVAGSLVSSAGAWWIERLVRRSAEVTRLKAAALRQKQRPLTDSETSLIKAVAHKKERRRGIPYLEIAIGAAVAAVVVFGALDIFQLVSGKPVNAIVSPPRKPEPTVAYTPAPVVSTPAPQPSPSPSAVPSEAPSPSLSPSPSAVPSPDPSPSPAPSGVPTSVP